MIQPGTTLQQRYKIDRQIGQGGMGAVYIATDARFGSTVAIKETLCMDDSFRRSLEREARLLNSLKHSALPRVSDHFEESNGQFLVMEYIPGEDVGSMLETGHAAFTVEQILKWADELLDALEYLHTQDTPVIHRDIKPQNLKVNSRGQIILLDFGLAKGNPTDASHQTAAKSIFGYSRNYASLEQIQGTGTDPRSDLYSLAATLYHLLTKQAPEDALTRAMSVLGQRGDPLVPASDVNREVSRGVAGVLAKALDLNADGRPASAAEMRRMLHDNEKYAIFAVATGPAAATQALGGATQLMADETASPRQMDIKTEIMPANLSQATSLAQKRVTDVPAKRRFGFAAVAGLLLALVGVVVGGMFIVQPWLFVAEPEVQKVSPMPMSVQTNALPDASPETEQAATGGAQAANVEEPQPDTKTEQTGPTKKTTVTQKNEPKVETKIVTQRPEPDPLGRPELEPEPYPPTQQRPPNKMAPPRIDPKQLTPAQRRKLQQMRRNGQLPPPPQPKS